MPKDLKKSALSSMAHESIKERLDWIDGRFSVAIENFENETELGLTLLQSRRMLREKVWPLCAASLCHERMLTFLINALDRTKPKSITKSQLNVLRENCNLPMFIEKHEHAETSIIILAKQIKEGLEDDFLDVESGNRKCSIMASTP